MNLTSKTQIDRLGDRLRKGKFGGDELCQLDDFRRLFTDAYEEVVAVVRKAAKIEPTGRPAKSTTSIVEKLRRETMRLTQMQDIAGCRLVVQDVLTQDKIVAELMAALPNAVVVDRRKQPSHGYRAVHIIATAQGKPVEIQIRTELQHLWAQLAEKLSDVFDPTIKYGGGGPRERQFLSVSSSEIAEVEDMDLQLERLAQGSAPSREHEAAALVEKLACLKEDWRRFLVDMIAEPDDLLREQDGE